MKTLNKIAVALATLGMTATAIPAAAADFGNAHTTISAAPKADTWDRHRRHNDDRRYRNSNYYGEPVYRNTRVWRGNDGRTYCRKKDGTTGLIIGGAAGALLGREIDSSGSRTVGTILGAAAGALIGKELDDGVKCR